MIGEGNDGGQRSGRSASIDALLDQTKSIERAVAALDLKAIEFEGSDSLDNPDKVQGESKAAGDGGGETELTMAASWQRYDITTTQPWTNTRMAGGLQ